jgi:hypothetical protein
MVSLQGPSSTLDVTAARQNPCVRDKPQLRYTNESIALYREHMDA